MGHVGVEVQASGYWGFGLWGVSSTEIQVTNCTTLSDPLMLVQV